MFYVGFNKQWAAQFRAQFLKVCLQQCTIALLTFLLIIQEKEMTFPQEALAFPHSYILSIGEHLFPFQFCTEIF